MAEPLAPSAPEAAPRRAIVTGNFDGCHLGHRALFVRLRAEAARRGLRPLVVSFSPHTRIALSGDCGLGLLTTDAEKRELLVEHYGLPLEVLSFDEKLRSLTAEEFVEKIVIGKLNASLWLMGFNHRFGAGAKGSYESMLGFAKERGLELGLLNAVEAGDETVSSTRIRALVASGRLREAGELLGYSYRLSGQVVRGAGRGRGLGFPTANLRLENPGKLSPPAGVYAGRAFVDGEEIPAVANLGANPTFGENRVDGRLEVHFLDWSGDLYGKRVVFAIEARLRPSRAFSSVEELKAQIARDVRDARSVVGR